MALFYAVQPDDTTIKHASTRRLFFAVKRLVTKDAGHTTTLLQRLSRKLRLLEESESVRFPNEKDQP